MIYGKCCVKLIYGSDDVTVSNKNILRLSKIKNWQAFEIKNADHFLRQQKNIDDLANVIIGIFK